MTVDSEGMLAEPLDEAWVAHSVLPGDSDL